MLLITSSVLSVFALVHSLIAIVHEPEPFLEFTPGNIGAELGGMLWVHNCCCGSPQPRDGTQLSFFQKRNISKAIQVWKQVCFKSDENAFMF